MYLIFFLNIDILVLNIDIRLINIYILLNPSFTKPFGTHTFYQGGGVGQTLPPTISKTVTPMNLEFCGVLEIYFNVLEMLKLFP